MQDIHFQQSGRLFDEQFRPLLVQRAFVDAGTSGDTQIVAAQAGIKFRVLSVCAVASASVTIKFRSNTTPISSGWPLAATGGVVLPRNEDGWFETAAGEALNVNLSATASVGVVITYVSITTP